MKIADKERKKECCAEVLSLCFFFLSFFFWTLAQGMKQTTYIQKPIASKFELFGLNNQYLHEVERGATVSVGDLVKIGGTHTF